VSDILHFKFDTY